MHLVGSSILLYLIDDARSNKNQVYSKFGNIGDTGNHGYYMNAAKPGKQGNSGNFKINFNVSNESSYDCVKFFHVKVPHV